MSMPDVRIVMVETWHPGNIGAAARAIKTMGLDQLVLVSPRIYPSEEATALAAGATDVLEKAIVVDSVEDAIKDCSLVIATSARNRSHPWPFTQAREFAQALNEQYANEKIAILFGPETSGLSNDVLRSADLHMEIPSNPEYGVLNVSSAIQIVAYEIFIASRGHTSNAQPQGRRRYPSKEQVAHFYQQLEETLSKAGFIIKAHPGQAMLRLKRLFTRARPEKTELNMLQGILSSMNKIIDREKD